MLSRSLVLSLFASLVVAVSSAAAAQPARATLGVYQGVRFADGTIVKSDDATADLKLYVNRGRRNAGAFALAAIGAQKIKEFDTTRPDVSRITRAAAATWDDSVNAPSAGTWFVVQGRRGGLYLVRIESFENQGKAASYWKLTLTFEPIDAR